jgi:hypothetical protein
MGAGLVYTSDSLSNCQKGGHMESTPPIDELSRQREALLAQLVSVRDMRPGSLVARYRTCGKPSCHCAGKGERGHGPSWSLTHAVAGKTRTKIIPATAVQRTKEQIAEYRRFRRLARELVEVSEKVCNAQLQAPQAASDEAAKKGGSKRPSKPRLKPRSNH